MNTTPHVTISTEQKIKNLIVALNALEVVLSREERNMTREHVVSARKALETGLHFYGYQSLARD